MLLCVCANMHHNQHTHTHTYSKKSFIHLLRDAPMHKPDPREAEPLNRSFNSAHMTQQKNNGQKTKDSGVRGPNDRHIHSQPVSHSTGWLCGRRKASSTTCHEQHHWSTTWKTDQSRTTHGKEADGCMTAARTSQINHTTRARELSARGCHWYTQIWTSMLPLFDFCGSVSLYLSW